MITLTSDKDKVQLRKHALKLLKQVKLEGLIILVDTLSYTDFEIKDKFAKQQLLIQAVSKGNLPCVKYLVENGANIREQDYYCLRSAAENNQLEIIKYLVEQGANVQALDNYSLRWTAGAGYFDIVKYLVEHGANIHVDRDYAFRIAAYYGHLKIVKYLVEQGANIHASHGFAIREAIINRRTDVVEYLLEQGADIEDIIQWASDYGQIDVVNYLKEVLQNDSTHQ